MCSWSTEYRDVTSERSLVARSSHSDLFGLAQKDEYQTIAVDVFQPLRASLKSWQEIGILIFEQTTRIDLRSRLG